MRLFNKRFIHEILFWGHIAVIVAGVLMGLILPLWLVVALVVAHRIHVLYLKSCAFSLVQQRVGGLEAEINFLQDAALRLFNRDITKKQATVVDYSLVTASLLIALLKNFIYRYIEV